MALDKRTGKTRWKTNRRQPADQAYTTPLVIRVGDRDQIVSVGAFRAAAYDPATGKEIWRVSYADGFSNVPRPVFGHGLVYIATGFQQPALIAVRPDGTGDVTKTHVAWTLPRGAPLTPSPLLVGDELYVVNDGGIATCLDADDRRGALADAAGRDLFGLAGLRRWPHLFSWRARRGDGDPARARIPPRRRSARSTARCSRRWRVAADRFHSDRQSFCIASAAGRRTWRRQSRSLFLENQSQ